MDSSSQNTNVAPPDPKMALTLIAQFLRGQSPALYAAIVLALVAAAAIALYFVKSGRDEAQAARLLGAAQTVRQFEELAARYPKSAGAPVAILAMASSSFSAGAYDDALARYEEFSAKYADHPLAAAAELGKSMCAEAKGETDRALAGFDAFIGEHAGHFLLPQAPFGKARCLQSSGRPAEAKAVYEDFIAANPSSKWVPVAESALQSLNRQMRSKTDGAAGQ